MITALLYLAAWLVLSASIPVWVPIAGAIGAWRRRSFVILRLATFLWIYLGLALWTLLRGVGLLILGKDEAVLRLGGLYAASLFRWCVRLMSMSVVVEGEQDPGPGPSVVLVRHVSVVDAALPAALLARSGRPTHYVLKAELRMEPCIGLLGATHLHAFVDRTGAPARELRKVRTLAEGLGSHMLVIYPEGTRYSEVKRERYLRELARSRPELAAIGCTMTRVLPPQLGGPLTALDATDGDCLIVAHQGLEGLATPHDFLRGDAVGRVLHVRVQRVPRRDLPPREERPRWLFERWKEVDDFACDPACSIPAQEPAPAGGLSKRRGARREHSRCVREDEPP